MPLESAAYLTGLVASNPTIGDQVETTYQHLNLIKAVLLATFPNASAAITGTPAQLNAAATAFSGGPLAVPQNGTGGGQVNLAGATGAASYSLLTASGGIQLVSNSTATPSVPTTELSTDGSGNLTVKTSITTPTLTATTYKQGGVAGALVPSGVIVMWSGAISAIPAGWYLCNGANGTPNLQNKFIVGAGSSYAVGAVGGATTVALAVANLPAHNHGVTDPGHNHGVNDPGHNHSLNNPSHTHGVNDPGHAHTYAALGGGGGNYNGGSYAGTFTTSTSTSGTGISIQAAVTAVSANATTTGVYLSAATTGISTTNTGSGTAFSILPPYYALALIMKS